eukprot:TRINITY_DN330_c0_g1_i2.p1 TRINITY_DN330_c0_g1~~TRINITY_DN330_c0_g1_i2.p1  ORF type:complete len:201 (-),score=51.68 TRINITY_DN330_c0_g1_i2:42-599(-)
MKQRKRKRRLSASSDHSLFAVESGTIMDVTTTSQDDELLNDPDLMQLPPKRPMYNPSKTTLNAPINLVNDVPSLFALPPGVDRYSKKSKSEEMEEVNPLLSFKPELGPFIPEKPDKESNRVIYSEDKYPLLSDVNSKDPTKESITFFDNVPNNFLYEDINEYLKRLHLERKVRTTVCSSGGMEDE